jgi:putative transposase
MKEEDIEIIIQRAREKYPNHKTRIISDNGPQFISRDFKTFIRLAGMDHVRTAPYYPQSNGKIERWHRELKEQCIRPQNISTLDEARSRTEAFVHEYNHRRLHAAIGYVTPNDKLAGNELEIFKSRDEKLAKARAARAAARRSLKEESIMPINKESTGGYGSAEEQPERQVDRAEQKTREPIAG